MKKILSILLLLSVTFTVSAQSTSPRWGNGANNDNTGRNLNYSYKTITEVAGADSATLTPSAFWTVVRVALTDSFYFKSPVVTKSYAGDNLRIIASGASGTKIKFAGTNFVTAGTATLSTSGRSVISLIFDGAKWVEAGRVTQ